jgi:hypothetical protein
MRPLLAVLKNRLTHLCNRCTDAVAAGACDRPRETGPRLAGEARWLGQGSSCHALWRGLRAHAPEAVRDAVFNL